MGEPSYRNKYPQVDLPLVVSACAASKYPTSKLSIVPPPPRARTASLVRLRYRKTRLRSSQWDERGDAEYCDRRMIVYAISGLVACIKYKREPTKARYFFLC